MPHDRFRAFIDAHHEFVVISHVDPDGDALGSCLGLAHALIECGRRVLVVNESGVPDTLRFLPGADSVRAPDRVEERFAAAFVLDCSALDRAGRAVEVLAPDATLAVIDHHTGNDGFGDPRLVNVESSATAELVAEILDACNMTLSPEVSTCLYAGLLSDTGSFRFQNTTARALRLAARLIDRGASAVTTAESLYGRKSAASLRILGLALASLAPEGDGAIGAMILTREMFERAGARPEDADGIVQYAKSLIGTRVGVLIQEAEAGVVKVSLRSDGSVDVNEVAGELGGGGHRTAAGIRLRGDVAAARERVLAALARAMNGGPPPPRG